MGLEVPKRQDVCVVDAFATERFRGNPAAVCVLAAPAPEEWMQQVAAELNLSETAHVISRADGGWDLRWFTPVAEVALCGHATLASAHALWEGGHLAAGEPARFHTRSGWLECTLRDGEISMDFPAKPAAAEPAPPGLAEALGTDLRWCGKSDHDWLVEVPHAATVRSIDPDFGALSQLAARGVIVTAASDLVGFDFVSRFFAPAVGIPEDPVTGSAHCTLGPFWAARLGRTRLQGLQTSRRGGTVAVEVVGSRVVLRGRAVTVWRGAFAA
ncbi:MAG: PhzF family phenazine biosynthesis protein [Verrucomicrobia bacterium]|nr:MAG: PhzF family phenazine biosynthesis protein [Verrucomicrobiota bacterium]